MPVASRSGSLDEDGPKREFRVADANDVAELQAESREQRLFDRGAECAILLGQRIVGDDRRSETGDAKRGQDGSTALISTSAASPLARPRHAAHRRDRRQRAVTFEEALLAGREARDG